MLFPIDWPEPFGLVMIEAMACGTPVIAFGCGSVPEVIDNSVSGILVDSVTEAAENVEWALRMDRRRVRATFEKRFTAERMACDYLDLYRNLPGVRTKAAPLRRSNGQATRPAGGRLETSGGAMSSADQQSSARAGRPGGTGRAIFHSGYLIAAEGGLPSSTAIPSPPLITMATQLPDQAARKACFIAIPDISRIFT